jgi:hypothetical protein
MKTYNWFLLYLYEEKECVVFRHAPEKDTVAKAIGAGLVKRSPYYQNVIESEDGSKTFDEREICNVWLTKKGLQKARELEFIKRL